MAHVQRFTHHALYVIASMVDRTCFGDATDSNVLARCLSNVKIGKCDSTILWAQELSS